MPLGMRVGVSWMGASMANAGTVIRHGESLRQPVFTGYTVDGGYAEYVLARADFTFPLPLAWMTFMSLRCCVLASSAFGACESRG